MSTFVTLAILIAILIWIGPTILAVGIALIKILVVLIGIYILGLIAAAILGK